jgi:hypothetical protein
MGGDVYRVEQEDLSGPWEVTNVLQPTVYENDKGEGKPRLWGHPVKAAVSHHMSPVNKPTCHMSTNPFGYTFHLGKNVGASAAHGHELIKK